MKFFYPKLLKFLKVIFSLYFVLLAAKILGFNFGLDITFLSGIVFALSFLWLILEIQKNWVLVSSEASKLLKTVWGRYLTKAGQMKEEIHHHSPKLLGREVLGIFLPFTYIVTGGLFFIFSLQRTMLSRKILCPLCILLIFHNIFFQFSSPEGVVLFLTIIWLIAVKVYKIPGKITFSLGLIFLSLCPLLRIFEKGERTDRAAIWTYVFLVAGVMQLAIETKRDTRK